MKVSNHQAQSFGEYAFLLVVVVAAFIALQIYAKRAIQGNLRLSSENLGEQPYSPGQTNSNIGLSVRVNTQETTSIDRPSPTEKVTTNIINTTQSTTRTSSEIVVRQ